MGSVQPFLEGSFKRPCSKALAAFSPKRSPGLAGFVGSRKSEAALLRQYSLRFRCLIFRRRQDDSPRRRVVLRYRDPLGESSTLATRQVLLAGECFQDLSGDPRSRESALRLDVLRNRSATARQRDSLARTQPESSPRCFVRISGSGEGWRGKGERI